MMSEMTLLSLVEEVNGTLSGDASFKRVCTDTRQLQAGDLFVALKGEHFDASKFVTAAANQGAVAAVTEDKPEIDIPCLLVKDSRKALGMIARSNRRAFKGPVIAITGSTGKTSCKQMLSSVLSESGKVLATKGNLNNEIGVPLTLLEINSDHQYAVVEMGASKKGDIEYLCQFAEPNVSLVTNIMPAHIEGFGDLETVAKTKTEIYKALSASGVAVVNLDDPFLNEWQKTTAINNVVSFSLENTQADIYASDIKQNATGGLNFILHTRKESKAIELGFLGKHNVANALAASAAAWSVGVSLDQIQKGLAKVVAVPGRLNLIHCKDYLLIDDSYNANPGSVKAAIDVLVASADESTLILGNMAELGERSKALHCEIGEYAKEKGVSRLFAIGERSKNVIAGFGAGGKSFEQFTDLLEFCKKQKFSGAVLVKGSRSAGMERIVSSLNTTLQLEGSN